MPKKEQKRISHRDIVDALKNILTAIPYDRTRKNILELALEEMDSNLYVEEYEE